MNDLRALTVKNPHAQLILDELKLYEYRTWKPPAKMIMNPFVLHTAKAFDKIAHRIILDSLPDKLDNDMDGYKFGTRIVTGKLV